MKRASEFKAQVVQITTMIRGMATTIALAALPQAERLVATFKGWISENREWIRLGIGKIIEGMGTAFERVWKAGKRLLDWVKDALGPVGDFFKELGKGADWSKLLTGALTLLLAAFAPLIAKIALISAGFALASAVVEDFFGFLEGKDSVIGRIIGAVKEWFADLGEKFPALRAMIEDIAGFVGGILKRNLNSIKTVIELISKIFDGLWGKVQSGIEKVASLGNELAKLLGYKDEAQEKKDKKLKEGEKEISDGLEQRTELKAPVGQTGLQAVRDSLSPDRSKRTKETQASPVALGTFAEQVAAYGQQRPGGVKGSPGGQMSMRVPQKNGPIVTDNREYNVYQTITPSDPRQAAEQAARSFSEIAQINTPGMNAPVVY